MRSFALLKMTWLWFVILNEVKNLSESKTVDRHVDLEIFRFAQDDNHNIMGYIFVTRKVVGLCGERGGVE